mgnify:CR=1 FL=1
MYEDGDKEASVARVLIRRPGESGPQLSEGTEVEARYGGRKKWFKGKITKVWRNGDAFDILYDDGDSERRVDKDLVRAVGGGDDDGWR